MLGAMAANLRTRRPEHRKGTRRARQVRHDSRQVEPALAIGPQRQFGSGTLVGPNGAGKSTLMRRWMGFETLARRPPGLLSRHPPARCAWSARYRLG